MIYTPDNLKVCLAAPFDFYTTWRDGLGPDFRTVSLSLAGPASAPIYTAVMVRLAQPFVGRSWAKLSGRAALKQKVDEMEANKPPLYPYIISATGSGDDVTYAACFREMASRSEYDPAMTEQQLAKACAMDSDAVNPDDKGYRRQRNQRPLWIDAFGSPGHVRYCAVWGDNPDNDGWNAEALNDKGAAAETRHEVLRSIGARPVHVALTPDGGRAKVYVDSQPVHSWFSAGLMAPDRMQEVCTAQAAEGRQPVCIGTTVIDNVLQYSAIFAKSDEIVPRSLRIHGPTPKWRTRDDRDRGAAMDAWVEAHLKGHGRRGAAMAIVKGTKLVYAKGYTYAEADVRNVEPTTIFRLASVAKAFCAVAVWKALFNDRNHDRGDTLQSILNLKTPSGAAPKGDFGKITLHQLLTCRSGIDQDSMRDAMARIKASHAAGTQPASVATLASEVAGTTMAFEPDRATKYGKTDYWLLGQVAAKLSGSSDFDAALKKLVLDPMQMKRTLSSGSRFDKDATQVPIYHRQDIATAESAIDDNRQLVPRQYGGENYAVFDGAGGVSSSVVDVARLCAMYSCRSGNPVFDKATQMDQMFDEAVAGAARADDELKELQKQNPNAKLHGCYYGFGIATGVSPTYTLAKGGDLPCVETDFAGTTGGLFIVFLRNGDPKPGASLPYFDNKTNGLRAIAEKIDWPDEDLFLRFDMSSL